VKVRPLGAVTQIGTPMLTRFACTHQKAVAPNARNASGPAWEAVPFAAGSGTPLSKTDSTWLLVSLLR
jgi:hypothetical protein